jgi:hypothetical protein
VKALTTTFADVFNIAGHTILEKLSDICPCCLKKDLCHLRLLDKQMATIIDHEIHSVQFVLNKKRSHNRDDYDEDDEEEEDGDDEDLENNLSWNKITPNTPEEAVMLKDKWPNVQELFINALLSGDTELFHRKTGPRRKGLRTLRLLVEAKAWPKIDYLYMSGIRFDSGPDSIKLMQGMVKLWRNVKSLTIDNVVFTPATMKIFARGWSNLEHLKVISYPFIWTNGTWDTFASSGKFNWKKLTSCFISAEWPRMDVLANKAKWLRRVELLSFEGTGLKICAKTMAALAKFRKCGGGGFGKLERLSFRRTNINAAGLVVFFTGTTINGNHNGNNTNASCSNSTVKNLAAAAAVPFANLSILDLSLCHQPNLISTLASIIKDGHLPSLKTVVIHMSPLDNVPSPHVSAEIATQFFEARPPGQLEMHVVPGGFDVTSLEEYREMTVRFQQHLFGGLMGMWHGGFDESDDDDDNYGDDDGGREAWWDDSDDNYDDFDDFDEDAVFENILRPRYY